MAKPYLSLKDVRVYFDPRTQSLRLISKDRRLRGKPFQFNLARDTPSTQALLSLLRSEGIASDAAPDPTPSKAVFPETAPWPIVSEVGLANPRTESQIRDHRLRFYIGETEHGALEIDLGKIPMTLVGGAPGGGKSEFMRTITRQVLAAETELWLIESHPHSWGKEFELREQDRMSVDSRDNFRLIEDLKVELERRLKLLGDKGIDSWSQDPELRPIFLVLDDLTAVVAFGEGSLGQIQKDSANQYLESLARYGRRAGIYSFISTSSAENSTEGEFRANFGRRIIFGGNAPAAEQNAMLGTVIGYTGESRLPPGRAWIRNYNGPLQPFQGYFNLPGTY